MALPRDFSVYDETGTNRLYFDNEYEYPTMTTVYSFLTANVPGVRYVSKTIGGTPYPDDTSMRDLYRAGAYTVYAIPVTFPSTIAGQIERLQYDKSCICAAIENKGVTVGNVTLDDYAACIDAIQQGGGDPMTVDILAIGGGGGGMSGGNRNGGGAGALCLLCSYPLLPNYDYCIIIGEGGNSNERGGVTKICGQSSVLFEAQGGFSQFGQSYSRGGCPSGGGDGSHGGGGGGGACGAGVSYGSRSYYGCQGGLGRCCMLGGGGGGGTNGPGSGCCGGGNGGCGSNAGGNATTCGSGGGGSPYGAGGKGGNGLVRICYKTDGSCGITCATGGTVSTSGGYQIHCFTSNGTFKILE